MRLFTREKSAKYKIVNYVLFWIAGPLRPEMNNLVPSYLAAAQNMPETVCLMPFDPTRVMNPQSYSQSMNAAY